MPRVLGIAGGGGVVALTSGRAAKGSRVLGLYVNQSESEGDDYASAFGTAQEELGLGLTTLARNWTDVEATPETYADPFLAIADAFYPAMGCALDLILRPVNTNRAEVPADLAESAWDSSEMIERFEAMLDYVFGQIPNVTLNTVAIGNEVDALFGSDSASYSAYRTFFEAARDRVLTLSPGAKVGVVAQLKGLTGESTATPLQNLNTEADVVLATYYPIDSGYQVRSPDSAYSDLADLVALYPGRSIAFTEVGYPSSGSCGSSGAKQAAFVSAFLSAWDDHRSRIISACQSWLTDLPSAQVEQLASYYGISDPAFKGFLRTLGLRGWPGSGVRKPAWYTFADEVAARGW